MMINNSHISFLLGLVISLVNQSVAAQAWKQLAPGMDLQNLAAKNHGTSSYSDITLVRIDPNLWDLVFMGISQSVPLQDSQNP